MIKQQDKYHRSGLHAQILALTLLKSLILEHVFAVDQRGWPDAVHCTNSTLNGATRILTDDETDCSDEQYLHIIIHST